MSADTDECLRMLPALPQTFRDSVFELWQPQFRLRLLYELLTIDHPLAAQLGAQLKYFCLTKMAVEKTDIVADASKHTGIAIPTPESSAQTMTASVLFSRMSSLKNKHVSGEINFIGLSATECRHAFQYLRRNVRLDDFENTLIVLHSCFVNLNDLILFCRGNGRNSFVKIMFYGSCTIYGGVVMMLQQLQCQDIQYNVFDSYLRKRTNVINMLNSVRREVPLQNLEIDYCRGPITALEMANFITHNMAENSSLAVYVDKMEYRANFYRQLEPVYHGPKLKVAFHRNGRTNEWEYREIGI